MQHLCISYDAFLIIHKKLNIKQFFVFELILLEFLCKRESTRYA